MEKKSLKKAVVIDIVPRKKVEDGWGYPRWQAAYVTIKCENGMSYDLVTGSYNGVTEDVEIGEEGYMEWVSTSSFGLPFFRKKESVENV